MYIVSSGCSVSQRLDLEFVEGQFSVVEQGLEDLKVLLENGVALEKVEHEFEDVDHLIFHLVEDPLVVLA